VTRIVRNRQFGIREDEWAAVLGLGLSLAFVLSSLGFWQLRRMVWKKDLIDTRTERLRKDVLTIGNAAEILWNEINYTEFEYRQVKLSGVLDHSREMLIGPRSFAFTGGGAEMAGGRDAQDSVGYLVVTPLLMNDGTQILVNRGAISLRAIRQRPVEWPAPVKVKGVLVAGELAGGAEWWRLANRPHDRRFLFLNVNDLAVAGKITRNFDTAKLLLVTATVEEELGSAGNWAVNRKYARKQPEDFLVFYGDEHTHLWYAVQWFACAGLLAVMSVWRSYSLARRWRW
jgi:cytochrome oxidase assembly protein ShyY1